MLYHDTGHKVQYVVLDQVCVNHSALTDLRNMIVHHNNRTSAGSPITHPGLTDPLEVDPASTSVDD